MPLLESDPMPPDHDRIAIAARSLDEIYRNERGGLLQFVSGQTDRDQAEDIVQSVFLRVAAGHDAAKIERPGWYLRRAARNLICDNARSTLVRRDTHHVPITDAALPGPDVIGQLEARDRLRRIEQAVERLKPLTRQIFLACRLDGYSYAEIAQQTGLSIRGVEKQMHRAIKQLGRHLRRHD
jgi:RNA polymerase sigma factor (sigma-70 family)